MGYQMKKSIKQIEHEAQKDAREKEVLRSLRNDISKTIDAYAFKNFDWYNTYDMESTKVLAKELIRCHFNTTEEYIPLPGSDEYFEIWNKIVGQIQGHIYDEVTSLR